MGTAQAAGLSEQQFNDCVTDKDAVAAMEKRVQAARAHGGVQVAALAEGRRGVEEAVEALLARPLKEE